MSASLRNRKQRDPPPSLQDEPLLETLETTAHRITPLVQRGTPQRLDVVNCGRLCRFAIFGCQQHRGDIRGVNALNVLENRTYRLEQSGCLVSASA